MKMYNNLSAIYVYLIATVVMKLNCIYNSLFLQIHPYVWDGSEGTEEWEPRGL